MFNTFEIFVVALWTIFVAYATWYFTSAKNYAPITHAEAKILWKIHKQILRCNATKWREIRRGNRIIGFQCKCGYRHIQKRPIALNTPAANIRLQNSQFSVLDELHSSYKST